MKKFLIILLLSLTSCGFSPVYSNDSSHMSSVVKLASIEVNTSYGLMQQLYKTELEDLLNPDQRVQEKLYKVDIDITKALVPIAIEQDRTITRYKVVVSGNYTLKDNSNKVISTGKLRSEGSYDKVESDYGTYISEDDTTKRIIRQLAEDTRNRLMIALVRQDENTGK